MKKLILIIFSITFLFSSNAQNPSFQWAKSIGGIGSKCGTSMAIDASGNVYTSGYFSGTSDFDPGTGTYTLTSAGGYDIFISKLDASGNFLWAVSMGGTGNDVCYSIALDANGNSYTSGFYCGTVDFDPHAGIFNLISAGNQDVFVCRINASGNFVWAKSMGGAYNDYSRAITLDVSGNVYSTGSYSGTADFDPGAGTFNLLSAGGQDMFISKLDPSGNFVWAKSMGGPNSDYPRSIVIDRYNNLFISGSFAGTCDFDPGPAINTLSSIGGSADIFVSKLNTSGNFLWAKSMGSTGTEYGNSLALDASGNIYTAGFFDGTVDFDPGPGTCSLISEGGYDIYISKLDDAGNFVWAKSMGGPNTDYCNNIALDAVGNVYTTGYFFGTSFFDPGTHTLTLSSSGSADIFISKLDALGNFVWAKKMGGTTSDYGCSIALDLSGNIYTTGSFQGISDFDPDISTFNLTALGSEDAFVHKMSQLPTLIETASPNIYLLNIYPNPVNKTINIEFNEENVSQIPLKNSGYFIKITNTSGQLIKEEEITFNNKTAYVKADELPNGTYLIQLKAILSNGNKVQSVSKKIIISK